ncbi:MAG: serine hydrolase [Anaerolineae bacterium]|nr:serine hydrolase [Anaerolineae bacterium]
MKRILLIVIVGLLSAIFRLDAAQVTCESPTHGWQVVAPEEVGLDGDRLAAGEAVIDQDLPYLRSVSIVRHGCIAYERYFGGADADTLFNGFSVTKSVTGTLIGMAIDEGYIASVNDPIGDYLTLPEDDPHRQITIAYLLKMLSGIDWDESSAADIGGMLEATRDEVAYILGLPLTQRPGTHWNYSTADSHLLSALLTAAVGESTYDYAAMRLFEPLGIHGIHWESDSSGINFGGTQLFWRARDMLKFGQLYLQGGVWDGETLIAPDWVAYVTRPQLADPSIYELSYAAHWWHALIGDYPPMHAAVGYGGQFIFVAPEQDVVIVITANSYVRPPDVYISGVQEQRQEQGILDYVERFILPAVQAETVDVES